MSIRYIVSVVFIFLLSTLGWVILGTVNEVRSYGAASLLDRAVYGLWGSQLVQHAPTLSVKIPGTKQTRKLLPGSNKIEVRLNLEQRRKGLLWYPTYEVDFSAAYTITNPDDVAQSVRLHFPLPAKEATYDRLSVSLDDQEQNIELNASEGINEIIELQAGQSRVFSISYRTRGLSQWRYRLAQDSGRVKDLQILVNTNFSAVDFPEGSLSPMQQKSLSDGMQLVWQADDLITNQDIAIVLPEKLNPGPLAARMSFFAPVCLLFFYILISAISIMKRIAIHPMHYLFVSGGFIAFHLLFAYLVDLINVHLAFAITSLVSVTLVVSYLKAALGKEFPWKIAAAGQLFYLVLFSYSFFLHGVTGLTVTIGSILTLAMLMRMTATLNWKEIFASKPAVVAEQGSYS